MRSAQTVRVPLERVSRRDPTATIAVVGNPNCGKSTLFNRLTGLRQRTANYPGVTVEKHVGTLRAGDTVLELIDLPGTFALSAHSLEERIAVDVILGRMQGTRRPAGILAVLDATRLYQGLYLLRQLLSLDVPVVVALTMSDAAETGGLRIDVDALSSRLGDVKICRVVGTTGQGMEALRAALATLLDADVPAQPHAWPELGAAADDLALMIPALSRVELERALVDGPEALHLSDAAEVVEIEAQVAPVRERLFGAGEPLAEEARRGYRWVMDVLGDVQRQVPAISTFGTRFGHWLHRPVPGTLGFFVVMAIVFQAVFAWATPLMDVIDAGAASLSSGIAAVLPEGMLASLLTDGVIAGIGSVLIFLPQILILFLFIIVLEDTGYLARAAYLMDRLMRSVGLSGQSIIPMISSFACAVPGIMATRVVPSRRDRIATIMAAPFMTCSARLPVYALLIAAFVPARTIGFINLQGLVLMALYLLGVLGGLATALILRKTALHGPRPAFALMLPEFRRPNVRTVSLQLLDRVRVFLRRAGTVIFAVAVVVWALAYFPRGSLEPPSPSTEIAAVTSEAMVGQGNLAAAAQLEQSWLGRLGKVVEPVFEPLGWDWKITAAVIAGFPAREVVVAVLGTIYAVGDDADEATLSMRLKAATWPDGAPVFTLPMVLGLLVFYAFCLQCAATLAVIRRETNSWRWPLFGWAYMTALGYGGALLIFQVGSRL